MSLINKELVNKRKGIVHGLSSFIPYGISKEYLFKCIDEFYSRIYLSDEEKEILLDTVNIYNLFNWYHTKINDVTTNVKEIYGFWDEIDKQQVEYISSFNFDKGIYDLKKLGNRNTYSINIDNLLKKI